MTTRLPNAETFPADCRDRDHWIVFRTDLKPDGRLSKIPLIPGTDRLAKINDPSTWRPFAVAYADATRRGLCLGYAITDEERLTLIDVDGRTNHWLIAAAD